MLTVGLVGCGRIGRRHMDAIEEVRGLSLVGVCDAVPEKAREVAEARAIAWTTTIDSLGDVDVAVIASPSGLHPEHVRAVIEGTAARYIVCEKPLALAEPDARELYRLAEERGRTILAVYQLRYNPLIRTLKHLTATGALGRVYQIIMNVVWNRNDEYFRTDWHGTARLDGGVLFTQASHYVDLLLYLLGEVEGWKGFSGRLRGLETPDTASACFRFRSGAIASLNATVCAYQRNLATEAMIVAEHAAIRVSGANLSRIDEWNVRDVPAPDAQSLGEAAFDSGHLLMYQHLAAGRLEEFPDPSEVLAGLRIMETLSRQD